MWYTHLCIALCRFQDHIARYTRINVRASSALQCNSLSHLHRPTECTCLCVLSLCVLTHMYLDMNFHVYMYSLDVNEPLRLDWSAIYISYAYNMPRNYKARIIYDLLEGISHIVTSFRKNLDLLLHITWNLPRNLHSFRIFSINLNLTSMLFYFP